MEAKDYKVLSVKEGAEWSNSFGTFQSYSLSLEGHGEPVGMNKKAPVSPGNEPKVGEFLFGTIEIKTNKVGSEYATFRAEKRPEGVASYAPTISSWSENPEKQDSIQRSVALGQAVALHGHIIEAKLKPLDKLEPVEDSVIVVADKFYAWLKNQPPEEQELMDKIFPKNEENHND